LAERPFDIRGFATYHYLAPPSGEADHSWLHLHGLAKFFCPDLEAFDVRPEVSHKALGLLMRVAAGLVQGNPLPLSVPQPYGHGAYRLRPSSEVRASLPHFTESDFDDEHSGPFLVLEDAGRLGSLDKLLRGAYDMEPKTLRESEAEQQVWQVRLPAIRTAWQERGDDQLMLRAALQVGQAGAIEHIWVAIDVWEGSEIQGRLLNDAFRDPSMVRGSRVTFDESLISAVSLEREQQALSEVETLRVLDPDAAALLDSALEASPTGVRTEESSSPDGMFQARFLDDGRVAYLQVHTIGEPGILLSPVWLYNRLPTPPLLDPRCSQEGLLPLMSQVYTEQRSSREAPAADQIAFIWSPRGVTLELDGEVWASVDIQGLRGWSKLIILPSRLGRPWAERPGEETVRESAPEVS